MWGLFNKGAADYSKKYGSNKDSVVADSRKRPFEEPEPVSALPEKTTSSIESSVAPVAKKAAVSAPKTSWLPRPKQTIW
jgi:hypothetical protein